MYSSLEQDYKMTEEKIKKSNLTSTQKSALDYMIDGKNIFLTGPSGTGKSMVIWTFKNAFGNKKKIAITSTTGISALLIGGTTVHSYLGLGLGKDTVENMIKKIKSRPHIKKRWLELDVLIIDEISMLSIELFEKIEAIGRKLRCTKLLSSNEKPFGGIQIILSGDFLQLPVVGSDNFCFESQIWHDVIDYTIYLKEIIRQRDNIFQDVLNDLRFGNITPRARKLLQSRIGHQLKNDLGIKPTKIYTTNSDVNIINKRELENLYELDNTLEFYQYDMDVSILDKVKDMDRVIEMCKKNCIAPDTLSLCKGAQVMLLYNLDIENGLVNGSRGVVTDFIEDYPVVKFLNGVETVIHINTWEIYEGDQIIAKIHQLPLKVAYAVTAHKCQGITLDYAEIDLSNIFTYGQGYVALSRVKNIEGLSIIDIDIDAIKAHPKAVNFYKELDKK